MLDQEKTVKTIGDFLGIPLVKIAVQPQAVGRYKTRKDVPQFDFLRDDLIEYGYLEKTPAAAKSAAKKFKGKRVGSAR